MNLYNMLQLIKDDFEDRAIDLKSGLEILNMTINDTVEEIGGKINALYKSKDYAKIPQYTEMAENMTKYEYEIQSIIEILSEYNDANGIEDSDDLDETDEETEARLIPNYADYIVDKMIEHSLNENFTHKRPYGFRLINKRLIETATWKDMLIKFSEILLTLHESKFLSLEKNKTMKGRKGKLISTNPKDMRSPAKVANRIFIETNLSSNSICNLIKKMLKEYGYKTDDFKVYLRADYTLLNK